MKTLYVSDLDGTLLRSNEQTSEYTNQTINALVAKGVFFSYATARSFHTARKATKGLHAGFPLIVYNGAMVVDNRDGSILLKNFFGPEINSVIEDLICQQVYPIVYSFLEGEEKFSFLPQKCSQGMREFLETRKNDKREHPVHSPEALTSGDIFYITCIDSREKLEPLYQKYAHRYHCVFHEDIYSKHQWLEIMPKAASKANAIRQLKTFLNCDRVVVFGDGKNDTDMFEMAEESYAVSNAVEELKQIATGIIGSNEEDAVAKWLDMFGECSDA